MGKFIYGVPPTTVDIDDRVLAHLRMVMTTKLRRSEPFMFEFDLPPAEGSGRRSFWVHPAGRAHPVPLLRQPRTAPQPSLG